MVVVKIKGLSIRKKFLMSMMIIILFSLCLTVFYSSYALYRERYIQVVSTKESTITLIAERMDINSRSFLNLFYSYVSNSQIRGILTAWGLYGAALDHEMWRNLSTFNFTTLTLSPGISAIEIYNLSGDEVFITQRSESSLMRRDALFWEGRDPSKQNTLVFLNDGSNILAVHQVNDFPSPEPVALIVFRLRRADFEAIIDNAMTEDNESVFLFNDNNQLIYHSTSSAEVVSEAEALAILHVLQEQNASFLPINGYFAFYSPIHGGRLQMLQLVPNTIIEEAIRQSLFANIIVAIIAFIVAAALSIVLSRLISRPIVSLSNKMKNLNLDSINSLPEHLSHSTDEIGLLEESFNNMVLRNRNLIDREYKSRIEKDTMQLKALQAQINPHFMYNTLQVMGSMAIEAESDVLYSTTLALGDMMRYSLDFANDMVTLKKELSYARSYIFIQNKRFNEEIRVKEQLSPEILDNHIPKLIIQPIVENAIEHGFPDKKENCVIYIYETVFTEADLCITIEDNGVGMPSDLLRQIQTKLAENGAISASRHIGLVNINSRLRLKYGEKYGLIIRAEEGKGTAVDIMLRREQRG